MRQIMKALQSVALIAAGVLVGRLSCYDRNIATCLPPVVLPCRPTEISMPCRETQVADDPTPATFEEGNDGSTLNIGSSEKTGVLLSTPPRVTIPPPLELQSTEKAIKRMLTRLCRSNIPGCPEAQNESLVHIEDEFGVMGGGIKVAVTKKGPILSIGQVVLAYDRLFEILNLFSYTTFLGVAMQMDPNDMVAIGDLVWRTRPDVMIELGTNMGGSAFFYASIMRSYDDHAMVITLDPTDRCVAHRNRSSPKASARNNAIGRYAQGGGDSYADRTCPHCVLASDTDLWQGGRRQARVEGEKKDEIDPHTLHGVLQTNVTNDADADGNYGGGAVHFIHGVPSDPAIVNKVEEKLASIASSQHQRRRGLRVMVMEDSNHAFDVVASNLEAYHHLVTPGNYFVVQVSEMLKLMIGSSVFICYH
jgi:cephalosporin hydroxylase